MWKCLFLLACGAEVGVNEKDLLSCDSRSLVWALTDSNRRPSACKADALTQLS